DGDEGERDVAEAPGAARETSAPIDPLARDGRRAGGPVLQALIAPARREYGLTTHGKSPRLAFAQDADLGLERHAEMVLHTIARQVHEGEHVRGHRAAAIDDEVHVLGRDLRAVEALAAEPHLLDHPARRLSRGVLPHAAGGGQGEGLARLLLLEPHLDVALDLGETPAVPAHGGGGTGPPRWRP